MKFYFAAIITSLLFTFNSFSQNALPIDDDTQLITYREVVEEEGNKETFFISAVTWINGYYKKPMEVTKTRRAESGLIEGLHRFRIKNINEDGTKTDAGTIQYEFVLNFKEGKYRYTLTNFILRQSSAIPVEKWLNDSDPQKQSYLKQIDEFAQSWIESLKEGMKPKAEPKDDDDW
jgi:hypothetical protein